MKHLTLFRHAKTERESTTGRDFDRVLNERGEKDAARMGAEIRTLGFDYDLILVSPAARAAQTAELAGLTPRFDERIYDAPASDLFAIVQQVEDGVGHPLIIGQNPDFERLASSLIGQELDKPTGSLVEIVVPVDHWSEIEPGRGRLASFIKPKELAA